MEAIRITHKGKSFDIDELTPFAIAILDLVYDGDLKVAKEDLKGTTLEARLKIIEELSEEFPVLEPTVYAPIEYQEFKLYLEEANLDLSTFKNGTFSGFRDKVMALADKSEYGEAQAFLQMLYDAGLDQAAMAEMKGTLYIEEGKIDEGIKWLEEAIEKNPALVSAYSALGQAYFNMGKYEEAAQYWEKELILVPGRVVTYFMLADAYSLSGQNDKAINVLKTLISNDPNNLLARYQLIELYREIGEEEEAKKLKMEILNAIPTHTNDIEIWARVQFEHGNYDRVKEIIEKFVETSPDMQHLKLLLVIPYAKTGDTQKACRLLKEFKNNEMWYYYGKKELFDEFLTNDERKACGIL